MKKIYFILITIAYLPVAAQFAPQATEVGTTAIKADSNIIKLWATSCSVERGFLDITRPSLGFVTSGSEVNATGRANTGGTVSLGDAGKAVLRFDSPIVNGAGPDFAVFENGFRDARDGRDYLEFAFVEVSSDGINYVRFPAQYVGDTSIQIGSYETTDARKYNNLAGKYWGGYGVPFDLEEVKNAAGLDVQAISHVRIVDAVGTIDKAFATRGVNGVKINEPWPTDFASGGFDLDAVGVINYLIPTGDLSSAHTYHLQVSPNPAQNYIQIADLERETNIEILDIFGNRVKTQLIGSEEKVDISSLSKGTYVVHINYLGNIVKQKLIVQ